MARGYGRPPSRRGRAAPFTGGRGTQPPFNPPTGPSGAGAGRGGFVPNSRGGARRGVMGTGSNSSGTRRGVATNSGDVGDNSHAESSRANQRLSREDRDALLAQLHYPPDEYFPPDNYVDQFSLPRDIGYPARWNTCFYCCSPKGDGHFKDNNCSRLCAHCLTKDHQGEPCKRLWLTRNFWKLRYGYVPWDIKNIRPAQNEFDILHKLGYLAFEKYRNPLGESTGQQETRKRSASAAGLQESQQDESKRMKQALDNEKKANQRLQKDVVNMKKDFDAMKKNFEQAMARVAFLEKREKSRQKARVTLSVSDDERELERFGKEYDERERRREETNPEPRAAIAEPVDDRDLEHIQEGNELERRRAEITQEPRDAITELDGDLESLRWFDAVEGQITGSGSATPEFRKSHGL